MLAVLVWLLPISIHIRLLSGLSAIVYAAICILFYWARHSASRRRACFRGLLMAPAVLVMLELGLAIKDRGESLMDNPLRMSASTSSDGLLKKNADGSYQFVPSRRYELWGGTVTIDRNGFRSTYDVTPRKTPESVRVLLIGGSSLFGWLVPDGRDIGAHLRAMLNPPGKSEKFEVINAAVPYYTSYQEMRHLDTLLAGFKPDIVVVLDGRNDVRYAIIEGSQWKPADEGGLGETPFYDEFLRWRRRHDSALLRSAIYRRLHAAASRFEPPAQSRPRAGPVDLRFIDQFVQHRQTMANQCRISGADCILALQPVIHLGKSLTEREQEFSRMWDDIGPAVREVWPRVRQAVSHSSESAVTLDLTELFADLKEEAYLDECHYSNEGNRLIAQRLAAAIVQLRRQQMVTTAPLTSD